MSTPRVRHRAEVELVEFQLYGLHGSPGALRVRPGSVVSLEEMGTDPASTRMHTGTGSWLPDVVGTLDEVSAALWPDRRVRQAQTGEKWPGVEDPAS